MSIHSEAIMNQKFFEMMKLLKIYLNHFPKDEKFVLKNSGYKELTTNYFYLFERLPIDWSDNPRQYKYQDFLYTNAIFKSTDSFKLIENIGELIESDKGVICLF